MSVHHGIPLSEYIDSKGRSLHITAAAFLYPIDHQTASLHIAIVIHSWFPIFHYKKLVCIPVCLQDHRLLVFCGRCCCRSRINPIICLGSSYFRYPEQPQIVRSGISQWIGETRVTRCHHIPESHWYFSSCRSSPIKICASKGMKELMNDDSTFLYAALVSIIFRNHRVISNLLSANRSTPLVSIHSSGGIAVSWFIRQHKHQIVNLSVSVTV